MKAYVLDGIRSGSLRVGECIPSENDLAATLGASRLTINRALRELADLGILDRVTGVGTFVATPKTTSMFVRVHNIADEIRRRGQTLGVGIHKLEKIKAQPIDAPGLRGDSANHVFHSLIVYFADGVPMQLENRFVSPRFAPAYLEQDFTAQSTTDYLQSIALPTRAEHEILATLGSEAEARLLELTQTEALLVVLRRTWVNESLTTCTRFVHPGARHRFFTSTALDGSDG